MYIFQRMQCAEAGNDSADVELAWAKKQRLMGIKANIIELDSLASSSLLASTFQVEYKRNSTIGLPKCKKHRHLKLLTVHGLVEKG